MKLLFPFLALLSLGTLLPAVSCKPYGDVESVTFPQLTTSSGTKFPDVQQRSSAHRNLLQGPVEVCNIRSSKKTQFWKRREMGFLFKIDFPESCENLDKSDLTECTDDINVKNGCCSKECIDVFRKISPECWNDLAVQTCSEAMTDDVMRMDGLRRRCFPELGPFSCENCDLQLRNKPDETQQQQLANLASVKVPEDCGKFKAVDLLVCENSFDVGPGCCDEACHNVLRSVSDACWVLFNSYACISDTASKSVETMNDLSKKCEPVHRPVSCQITSQGNHFKTDLSQTSLNIKRDSGPSEAPSTTTVKIQKNPSSRNTVKVKENSAGRGERKIALAAWAITLIVIAYAL